MGSNFADNKGNATFYLTYDKRRQCCNRSTTIHGLRAGFHEGGKA